MKSKEEEAKEELKRRFKIAMKKHNVKEDCDQEYVKALAYLKDIFFKYSMMRLENPEEKFSLQRKAKALETLWLEEEMNANTKLKALFLASGFGIDDFIRALTVAYDAFGELVRENNGGD